MAKWHIPGVAAMLALLAAYSPVEAETVGARHFTLCGDGGGRDCVVDGDTFHLGRRRIRIADIDTPETHPPRCRAEEALGRRATVRLQRLLNAGDFRLQRIDRDRDVHGRQLRIVLRGGQSIGGRLVIEGLARPWIGYRRPWC